MNKEEIVPFKKYTEGDFIHEIRRLNRVVSKLSKERDNLQSQLEAKEEVIKEAREIVKYRLKENDGHINARMEMFHYRNLDEILSKGENK